MFETQDIERTYNEQQKEYTLEYSIPRNWEEWHDGRPFVSNL